jgi:predicted DNA-binding transcriptional regulator YafY
LGPEEKKIMRADRLLRLTQILADGRRRTASSLAARLEVSERTILRDVEALQDVGVPITASPGSDGGIALPAGWGRLITGLSAGEVRALAALATSKTLGELGEPLDSALAKVLAALPTTQRALAEQARQRLLIDPEPWWRGAGPQVLDAVHEALWADRQLRLSYEDRQGRRSERDVSPLGLVLKGGRWHLLAETAAGRRVFRGDRVRAVTLLEAKAARPEGFELREAWREATEGFVTSRPRFDVTMRLTPAGRALLAELRPAAERAQILSAEGPLTLDLQQEEIAWATVTQLGEHLHVLAPEALRVRAQRMAQRWLSGGEPSGVEAVAPAGDVPVQAQPGAVEERQAGLRAGLAGGVVVGLSQRALEVGAVVGVGHLDEVHLLQPLGGQAQATLPGGVDHPQGATIIQGAEQVIAQLGEAGPGERQGEGPGQLHGATPLLQDLHDLIRE